MLDASVALAWFLDDPQPAYATSVKRALLGGAQALVPALWHLEVANGFVVAERRRILTPGDILSCVVEVEELVLQAVETSADLVSVRYSLNTARAFNLSAYDAVYLDTARNQGLALATLDKSLHTAALRAGVGLFR